MILLFLKNFIFTSGGHVTGGKTPLSAYFHKNLLAASFSAPKLYEKFDDRNYLSPFINLISIMADSVIFCTNSLK